MALEVAFPGGLLGAFCAAILLCPCFTIANLFIRCGPQQRQIDDHDD